ncbi:hypothetical protein K0M31_011779 [Melipona bicolor]|uniref:Uncharacterized protein n=1 Tax=Melipona bicolor TaxID=60889 RepID=A0AA40GA86_9HYME|nr:hypothetical protein K0M31_011779 [Melipona bicolor]
MEQIRDHGTASERPAQDHRQPSASQPRPHQGLPVPDPPRTLSLNHPGIKAEVRIEPKQFRAGSDRCFDDRERWLLFSAAIASPIVALEKQPSSTRLFAAENSETAKTISILAGTRTEISIVEDELYSSVDFTSDRSRTTRNSRGTGAGGEVAQSGKFLFAVLFKENGETKENGRRSKSE